MKLITANISFHQKDIVTHLIAFLLVILIFSLPLFGESRSALILLSATLILCVPAYRNDLKQILYQPWVLSSWSLFFIAFIACFWGPSSLEEKIFALEKYNTLLLLPILTVGFRSPGVRRTGLYAFLFAMIITCIASILQKYGLFPVYTDNSGRIFHDHIVTSYMMAFAAYLAATLGIDASRGWLWKASHFGLMMIYSTYILFVNDGRIGDVLYLFLAIIFFLQHFSRRQLIIFFPLFVFMFGLAYLYSPIMQQRSKEVISEIQTDQVLKLL